MSFIAHVVPLFCFMSNVLIRYIGSSGNRTMDEHSWSSDNDFTCEVDLSTAVALLTYPLPNQFELAKTPDKKVKARLAKALELTVPEFDELFVAAETAVDEETNLSVDGAPEAEASSINENIDEVTNG